MKHSMWNKKQLKTCLIFALLSVWAPASIVVADEPMLSLPLSDEADRDDSFVEYRNALSQSVKFREPEQFVTLVNIRVLGGYDTGQGMQEFAQAWRIDAIDSPLWPTMEQILALGGGFVRSNKGAQFCAPYVFTDFPETLDPRTHGVVVSDNASLMDEPSFTANVIGSLAYDLVKVDDWKGVSVQTPSGATENWVQIKSLKGPQGWLSRKEVRSPLDPHACFVLSGGKWSMISLVNGWDGLASRKKVPLASTESNLPAEEESTDGAEM